MKEAIAYGINAYPSPYELQGPLNDMEDVRNTLLNYRGYSAVATLPDAFANRQNLLSNLQNMIGRAEPGDTIAFIGSSHGSYAADASGDEADHKDEGICPIDVFEHGLILDDEFRAMFQSLDPGVKLIVMFDSCYSGTATRGIKGLVAAGNYPSKAKAIPGPLKASWTTRPITPVSGLNHIFLAACKDNQTAWEGMVGTKVRGLLSYYTCYYLRRYPACTWTQLINYLQAKAGSLQTPQLEMDSSHANELAF